MMAHNYFGLNSLLTMVVCLIAVQRDVFTCLLFYFFFSVMKVLTGIINSTITEVSSMQSFDVVFIKRLSLHSKRAETIQENKVHVRLPPLCTESASDL